MPFKDGRLTPAEKRALSKRYGEEEGTYRRAGANYLNEDTPDTYRDRITNAANKDYDTREQQKAFDLALRDEEFRKTLDPRTQKVVENYNNGKDHDKGMAGVSSMSDVLALSEFGKTWHKRESGNGGQYNSNSDYGGATQHMNDRMRKFYDRNFVTRDDVKDNDDEPVNVAKVQNKATDFWKNVVSNPNFERYDTVEPYRAGERADGSSNDDAATAFKNRYVSDLAEGLTENRSLNLKNAMHNVSESERRQGHINYMSKMDKQSVA